MPKLTMMPDFIDRNINAHGDIVSMGEKEVAVYRVLQAAIYFMLLDGADLGSDTLRVIGVYP